MILNTEWKDRKWRKNLGKKNFTNTKKFYVHEMTAVNLSSIFFFKYAKKTYKPNNRHLNRDWTIPMNIRFNVWSNIRKRLVCFHIYDDTICCTNATACHTEILDFGIRPFPSKSKVIKKPKFHFLNFTNTMSLLPDFSNSGKCSDLMRCKRNIWATAKIWYSTPFLCYWHTFTLTVNSLPFHLKILQICIFTWSLILSWNRLS